MEHDGERQLKLQTCAAAFRSIFQTYETLMFRADRTNRRQTHATTAAKANRIGRRSPILKEDFYHVLLLQGRDAAILGDFSHARPIDALSRIKQLQMQAAIGFPGIQSDVNSRRLPKR